MKTKKSINPTFDDFVVVSRKQVELAIYIRQFRRMHNLSQEQMARICSAHGRSRKISFSGVDISNYENYKHIPTPPKFQTLMSAMDLDPIAL